MRILHLACLLGLISTSSSAQERVLTPEKAKGFDRVITQCISLARLDFANNMCDTLATSVADLARANGLKHVDLGRTEWGFGSDVFLVPEGDQASTTHVNLTFYIRATTGPSSMFIWASLYTASDRGRLVLWEDSGIGAGDTTTVPHDLANGFAQVKLKPIFKVLGEGRP